MKCYSELVSVLKVLKGLKCCRLVVGSDLNFQLGSDREEVTGNCIHRCQSGIAHIQAREDLFLKLCKEIRTLNLSD